MQVILVMIGGFFGAIARFSVGEWFHSADVFPFATLFVNLVGCFLLGWFLTFMKQRKKIWPRLTLFIGTGFIGSFTTFSTFSVETIQLFENDHVLLGAFYVIASIIFGLLLAFIGSKIAIPQKKEGDIV
ncbi:MAG TPA: fluoride efflux transporter CrcB [Bacillus bacterium]|nr:fluoride efflux transporter CrcB [Bacillus sp. (in: firmicutes)]